MHPCPCGRVMGCPIAMGRSMSADASSHRFVCARVPQSGCNGDFVIDGGGTGGTLGIVHRTVPCLGARLCIRIPTYVVLVVHCMGHASVPASWLGQHSRKPQISACVRSYSGRTYRTNPSTPSRSPENRLFSGMREVVLGLVR